MSFDDALHDLALRAAHTHAAGEGLPAAALVERARRARRRHTTVVAAVSAAAVAAVAFAGIAVAGLGRDTQQLADWGVPYQLCGEPVSADPVGDGIGLTVDAAAPFVAAGTDVPWTADVTLSSLTTEDRLGTLVDATVVAVRDGVVVGVQAEPVNPLAGMPAELSSQGSMTVPVEVPIVACTGEGKVDATGLEMVPDALPEGDYEVYVQQGWVDVQGPDAATAAPLRLTAGPLPLTVGPSGTAAPGDGTPVCGDTVVASGGGLDLAWSGTMPTSLESGSLSLLELRLGALGERWRGTAAHATPHVLLVRDGVVVGGTWSELESTSLDIPAGASERVSQSVRAVGCGTDSAPLGEPLPVGEYQIWLASALTPSGGEQQVLVDGPWSVPVVEATAASFPECSAPEPSIHQLPDVGLTLAAEVPSTLPTIGGQVEFGVVVAATQGRSARVTVPGMVLVLVRDGVAVGLVPLEEDSPEIVVGPDQWVDRRGSGTVMGCAPDGEGGVLEPGEYTVWPGMQVMVGEVIELDGTTQSIPSLTWVFANPVVVTMEAP